MNFRFSRSTQHAERKTERKMAKLNLLSIAIVARDMIDKGWVKGTWHRRGWRDGEAVDFVCTEGAIQQSMRLQIASELNLEPSLCTQLNSLDASQRETVIRRMSTALSKKREKHVFGYMQQMLGVDSIPEWNDSTKRTKKEVLRLFDQLIDEIEQLPVERQQIEFALTTD
jgi:hypothetical protein